MRDVVPFKFTPAHQDEGAEAPVVFELEPLELPELYALQLEISRNGVPSWEVAEPIVRKCLIGWSGLEVPYSREAKLRILRGAGGLSWVLWIGQIIGELYRRAILTDAEKKT